MATVFDSQGSGGTAVFDSTAPSASMSATAYPAGVAMTAAVGTATAFGSTVVNATAFPAGVVMTAYVGQAAASGVAATYAFPAGVQMTAAVGVPTVRGDAIAYPAGVQMRAAVGYAHGPINLASYPQAYAMATMSAGPLYAKAKMSADSLTQIASFV